MNEVAILSDEMLKLSPMQLDALREIGNVGAGNSATALSQIINRKIDMSVPDVAIMPLDEVPDVVGGPDVMVVGVFLRVYGLAPGSVLFLLPKESAFYLIDMLMGKERGQTQSLDFMDESALMEIGNIDTATNAWEERQKIVNDYLEPALQIYFSRLGTNPFEEIQ